MGGGDDQYIPDASQHEDGEGIVDHGFVVNGLELFADHARDGIEAGASPTCE